MLRLRAQNGKWFFVAKSFIYQMYTHDKFFIEIPLCAKEVIFITEFAILPKIHLAIN